MKLQQCIHEAIRFLRIPLHSYELRQLAWWATATGHTDEHRLGAYFHEGAEAVLQEMGDSSGELHGRATVTAPVEGIRCLVKYCPREVGIERHSGRLRCQCRGYGGEAVEHGLEER